jgi:catechol 2,3-dioxygenase-like lactoylglutathione lyase family enzyme
MIDHLSLPVSDVEATARTYAQALAPLGYSLVMSITREQIPQLPFKQMAGLGAKGKPDLWLRTARTTVDATHIALRAEHRKDVEAFHVAALAAGLIDDGGPGVRAHYHRNYYAAFVRDLDGHSLEVVCHAPPPVKVKAKKQKKAPASKPKPAAKKRR